MNNVGFPLGSYQSPPKERINRADINNEARSKIETLGVTTSQFSKHTNLMPIYSSLFQATNYLKSKGYETCRDVVNGKTIFEIANDDNVSQKILDGLRVLDSN